MSASWFLSLKNYNSRSDPILNNPSKDYPILAPGFCAFLDILGFKQQLQEAHCLGRPQRLVDDIAAILNESTDRIASASERNSFLGLRFFTDCICIGYECDPGGEHVALTHLCELVADCQLAMACHGLYVRGAITYGALAFGDRLIIGDSLFEAHALESEVAKWPRVIISAKVFEKFGNTMPGDFKSGWGFRVWPDSDGYYFINYLSEAFEPQHRFSRILGLNEGKLKTHGERIERELIKFKDDARILSKYIWSANYHNAFCARYKKEQFKIKMD